MRQILAGIIVCLMIVVASFGAKTSKVVACKCIVERPFGQSLQLTYFLVATDGSCTEVSVVDYYRVRLQQRHSAKFWVMWTPLMQPRGEVLCMAD